MKQNMETLGVAIDANNVVTKIKPSKNKFIVTNTEETVAETLDCKPTIAKLEAQAAIKKPATFRFSSEQVKYISSMMDKHKLDFKAMARDPKNHFQETPKQIEHKIRKFMSIPDHYAVYCKERGLIESSPAITEDLEMDT